MNCLFQDSLKVAAQRQSVMRTLYREDSATFREIPESKVSFSVNYGALGYSGYRDDRGDSDSDDDGPRLEKGVNGLEELD